MNLVICFFIHFCCFLFNHFSFCLASDFVIFLFIFSLHFSGFLSSRGSFIFLYFPKKRSPKKRGKKSSTLKKKTSKDKEEDPKDVKMKESGETKDGEDLVQRMQDSPFNLESPHNNGTKN